MFRLIPRRASLVGLRLLFASLCSILLLGLQPLSAQGAAPASPPALKMAPGGAFPQAKDTEPLLKLGVGDSVTVDVYGQPQLKTTTYVADDGTISLPLVGSIQVKGLSPSIAGQRIAQALRDGQFVLDPQVNVTLSNFTSQQISVLGEVRGPGRFPVASKTTVLDAIAQAGGITELGSYVVYVLRPNADNQVDRFEVDLQGILHNNDAVPALLLKGGDSVFVPLAKQYFIYGEVRTPNKYRLEPGLTVIEAITIAGGVTERGSQDRVEIKRTGPDGKTHTISPNLNDPIEVGDVIRVKERIF